MSVNKREGLTSAISKVDSTGPREKEKIGKDWMGFLEKARRCEGGRKVMRASLSSGKIGTSPPGLVNRPKRTLITS